MPPLNPRLMAQIFRFQSHFMPKAYWECPDGHRRAMAQAPEPTDRPMFCNRCQKPRVGIWHPVKEIPA